MSLARPGVLMPAGFAGEHYALPLGALPWRVGRVDDEPAQPDHPLDRIASDASRAAGGGALHVASDLPPGLLLAEQVAAACVGALSASDDTEVQAAAARRALQKAVGRPLSHAVEACLTERASFASAHFPTPEVGSLDTIGAWLRLVIPHVERFEGYRPRGQVDRRQLSRAYVAGATTLRAHAEGRAALLRAALADRDAEQYFGTRIPGFFPAQRAALAHGALAYVPVAAGPAIALIARRRRDLARALDALALVHRAHQLTVTISEPQPL